VIERIRNLSLPRRHPSVSVLSRYLDDDLDPQARQTLETHVQGCPRCRSGLASLASTLRALGSPEAEHPDGLADSIIAALHADAPDEAEAAQRSESARVPALTLVPGSPQASIGDRMWNRWPHEAHSALRWCLQRTQLRLTLPIALVTGAVLSLVNMGGMLMHGKIDLGVCVSCAIDFLVPFFALNLGLLMLLWAPRRRRLPPA
jgi:anti-sigma factor RsiW